MQYAIGAIITLAVEAIFIAGAMVGARIARSVASAKKSKEGLDARGE